MNGKKARALRKKVYEEDNLPLRARNHFKSKITGQVVSDDYRGSYQKIKKEK